MLLKEWYGLHDFVMVTKQLDENMRSGSNTTVLTIKWYWLWKKLSADDGIFYLGLIVTSRIDVALAAYFAPASKHL